MPYATTTFGDLTTQLAGRLDSTLTFWPAAELQVYLKEALRTWNALSGYWRQRAAFQTVAAQAFYDLPSISGFAGIFDYTITCRQLVQDIEYALMEPINGFPPNTWSGSDMFTMEDVIGSIQRRRNQFLLETAAVLTHEQLAVGPVPPAGRFNLPETYITVRRAAWLSLDDAGDPDTYSVLWREDEWAFNAFINSWMQTPARPKAFSIAMTPPVMMQLAPVPLDEGKLDIVAVKTGAAVDVTTNALLGIPDDFAWIIKYGAMADLLSQETDAYDPARADYCEQRYQQGVNLARLMAAGMNLQINDRPIQIDALYDWDTFDAGWQNTSGTPKRAALCGFTMLALNEVPDGVYGVSLDLNRKAPIPINDLAFVQLGQEQLDTLLDLGEHIARFKQGGSEFSSTLTLFQRVIEQAKIYNGTILEAAPFNTDLKDRQRQEQDKRPSRTPRPVEVGQ